MDDHYAILGLPSGEEGFKLRDKEITKAYKSKALQLHPDKRPNDPNAIANFQKLQTSYHILKDENARKIGVKFQRQSQKDPKRKRMKSELEKRERSTSSAKATNVEEDIIWRKLKEEIKTIRARYSNKSTPIATATVKKSTPIMK